MKSKDYWENRYQKNGNSGAGSYGILADYKADIINEFITVYEVKTVVEFGFGDGNQLSKLNCPKYTGYDVSETALTWCTDKFKNDKTKKFYISSKYKGQKFDLSMSLDVIYHLTDTAEFAEYMHQLFNASKKHVIIYSSNGNAITKSAPHIKDQNFTDWVTANHPEFALINHIANPHKYDESRPDSQNTSICDFFIFERV